MEAISAIEAHVARAPKKANTKPYIMVTPPPLINEVVKNGMADSQVHIIVVVNANIDNNLNRRFVACTTPSLCISAASRPVLLATSPLKLISLPCICELCFSLVRALEACCDLNIFILCSCCSSVHRSPSKKMNAKHWTGK